MLVEVLFTEITTEFSQLDPSSEAAFICKVNMWSGQISRFLIKVHHVGDLALDIQSSQIICFSIDIKSHKRAPRVPIAHYLQVETQDLIPVIPMESLAIEQSTKCWNEGTQYQEEQIQRVTQRANFPLRVNYSQKNGSQAIWPFPKSVFHLVSLAEFFKCRLIFFNSRVEPFFEGEM